MWKGAIAYPIIALFSRIANATRWAGDLVPLHKGYRSLFDRLIGVNQARKQRDEHVDEVVQILESLDEELPMSKETLVADVQDGWRTTEARFSNGESILALAVAAAGFFRPVVSAVLAVLLIISVSVRMTAIDVLAYKDPSVESSKEQLFAQMAWNNDVLSSSHVVRNTLGVRLLRWFDERLYDIYLTEVFAPAVKDAELSRFDALRRVNPEFTQIVFERLGAEPPKVEEKEEAESKEETGK